MRAGVGTEPPVTGAPALGGSTVGHGVRIGNDRPRRTSSPQNYGGAHAMYGASPYGGRCRNRIEAPVRTGPVHRGGGPTFSVTASHGYKFIISIRSSTPWTRIGDVARVELIDLHNKSEWKRNICTRVIIRIYCVQCRNDRPTERSLRRYRFLVYTLRLNAKRARIPKCRADG